MIKILLLLGIISLNSFTIDRLNTSSLDNILLTHNGLSELPTDSLVRKICPRKRFLHYHCEEINDFLFRARYGLREKEKNPQWYLKYHTEHINEFVNFKEKKDIEEKKERLQRVLNYAQFNNNTKVLSEATNHYNRLENSLKKIEEQENKEIATVIQTFENLKKGLAH